MEIGEVFALMVELGAKSQEATVDEKGEDDLGMTNDEGYGILQMFIKDSAINVEGCVAKTWSLAICDVVLVKRLEGVDNLENEVYSPKSSDVKEGMVEHMISMTTCKVGSEIEANTFDCAIVCSMDGEYGERPDYIQLFWARATIETQVKLRVIMT